MRVGGYGRWVGGDCSARERIAGAGGSGQVGGPDRPKPTPIWYQGEYAGGVGETRRGWIWTGLQVIARGSGRFEAVQYRGGLPGAGWDRQAEGRLSGELTTTFWC